MNLILFGFKGSGKTHFGKLLAQKMHRRFIDTDDWIDELYAKKTGQHTSNREIYIQLGPAAFRALEKEVVKSLTSIKDAIVALGGGAVLDPEKRRASAKDRLPRLSFHEHRNSPETGLQTTSEDCNSGQRRSRGIFP